jgi:hypothetical protein
MTIPATLEQRKSKAGNNYHCVVIKITESVEKLVFLEAAELELLRISHGKNVKLSTAAQTQQ